MLSFYHRTRRNATKKSAPERNQFPREAQLGIINNAPGTASPIPGLLAPFVFNDPVKVLIALGCAIVSSLIGGLLVSEFFLQRQKKAK